MLKEQSLFYFNIIIHCQNFVMQRNAINILTFTVKNDNHYLVGIYFQVFIIL